MSKKSNNKRQQKKKSSQKRSIKQKQLKQKIREQSEKQIEEKIIEKGAPKRKNLLGYPFIEIPEDKIEDLLVLLVKVNEFTPIEAIADKIDISHKRMFELFEQFQIYFNIFNYHDRQLNTMNRDILAAVFPTLFQFSLIPDGSNIEVADLIHKVLRESLSKHRNRKVKCNQSLRFYNREYQGQTIPTICRRLGVKRDFVQSFKKRLISVVEKDNINGIELFGKECGLNEEAEKKFGSTIQKSVESAYIDLMNPNLNTEERMPVPPIHSFLGVENLLNKLYDDLHRENLTDKDKQEIRKLIDDVLPIARNLFTCNNERLLKERNLI